MLFFIKNNPQRLLEKYLKTNKNSKKKEIMNRLIVLDAEAELLEIFKEKKDKLIQSYLYEKYKENSERLLWLYQNYNNKQKIIKRLIKKDAEAELLEIFKEKKDKLIQNYLYEKYKEKRERLLWLYSKYNDKQMIVERLVEIDAENELMEIFKMNNENKTIQSYFFNKYNEKPKKLSLLVSNNSRIIDYYIWKINNNNIDYKKFYENNSYFLRLTKFDFDLLTYVFDKFKYKYKIYILLSTYGISNFAKTPDYIKFPKIKDYYQNVFNNLSKSPPKTQFSHLYERVYKKAIEKKSEKLFRLAYLLDKCKFEKKLNDLYNNKKKVNNIIKAKNEINKKFSKKMAGAKSRQEVKNLLNSKKNNVDKLYDKNLFKIQYEVSTRYPIKITPYKLFENDSAEEFYTTKKQLLKSYIIVKDQSNKISKINKNLKNKLLNLTDSNEIMKAKSLANEKISRVISKNSYINMIKKAKQKFSSEKSVIENLGKILANEKHIDIQIAIIKFSAKSKNKLWLQYLYNLPNKDKLQLDILISIINKLSTKNLEFITNLFYKTPVIRSNRILRDESRKVKIISFSHDSKKIVTKVSNDERYALWDINTGKKIKTNSIGGYFVASSSIGNKIITKKDYDSWKYTLWDINTGKKLKTYSLEGDFVASSFTENKIITRKNRYSGDYKLWDINTGKKLKTYSLGEYFVASSSIGNKIITKKDYDSWKYTLWDINTGKKLKTYSLEVDFVAFSSTGNKIITRKKRHSGDYTLWDINAGKKLKNFKGFVAISPDGKRLVIKEDEKLIFWDINIDKEFQIQASESTSWGQISFSPDGKKLAAVIGNDVLWWDLSIHQYAIVALVEHLLYFLINNNSDGITEFISFNKKIKLLPTEMHQTVKEIVKEIIDHAGKQSKRIELSNENKPESKEIEIK